MAGMKTIAVIASCDTKYKEVGYIKKCLDDPEIRVLVVDMATGPQASHLADISRETVAQNVGVQWDDIKGGSKAELIGFMKNAIKATILQLYQQQAIDGVLAVGGMQNSVVAAEAMRALPIGFPTVLASTIASGNRPFQSLVGDKDVVVIPSISDFSGLNSVTQTIIANACACLWGLVQRGGGVLKKGPRQTVGISLMGITNTAACAAVEELDRLGIEAIGFHSSGVGGRIMEQLAEDGFLDGILDLSTHEVTAEYFGYGASAGTQNRLLKTAGLGIPLVVSVGGLDFIDCYMDSPPPQMERRVYNLHNGQLAHIKILPEEAENIGRIFGQRVSTATNGAVVLLPTDGMRQDTQQGRPLYAPDTDRVLLEAIRHSLAPHIRVHTIEGNLNDAEWGKVAARYMAEEMKNRGGAPA